MSDEYKRQIAAVEARRLAQERSRQEYWADHWRKAVLTPSELERYTQLVTTPDVPPAKALNRAQRPYYVALALLSAAWLVTFLALIAQSSRNVGPPLVISAVVLLVVFAIAPAMARKGRTVTAEHKENKARAIKNYLDEIGYEGRLHTAQEQAGDGDDDRIVRRNRPGGYGRGNYGDRSRRR